MPPFARFFSSSPVFPLPVDSLLPSTPHPVDVTRRCGLSWIGGFLSPRQIGLAAVFTRFERVLCPFRGNGLYGGSEQDASSFCL